MKILIDNGHGVDTKGKRSPVWPDGRQLFEWEFNRDIAKRVYGALVDQGVDCELIVKETNDIRLSERCNRVKAIAEKIGKENCLLVSIHANAGGGTGWEIYHFPNSEASAAIARKFSEVVNGRSDFPFKNRGVKSANFQILRCTPCPAVLTENLFMDTKKDCDFLFTEEGRRVIADIHVQAILNVCFSCRKA